jgi:nitrogen fixation/metabolism regulation signal transduction histidine kinase
LGGKLAEADEQVLAKSVKTIVDQVDAMKRLVNEFRDYARLPAADLRPVNLNALLEEVLSMYSAADAPEGSALRVPVRQELDKNCPPVMGDLQQLRQVIHNLVQNAQDATEGFDDPQVTVRTQWMPAAQRVRLVVRDSGSGFPESILKRAFEPYVTTKAKGTGLGLAVVKKIADEHGARLEITNRQADGHVAGAQVSLSFPVATDPVARAQHGA